MQNSTFSQKPFRYADGLTRDQFENLKSEAGKALSETERYRLVKASKSPTAQKPPDRADNDSVFEPIRELDGLEPVFEADTKGPGRYTVIQYREWSEEYRLFTRVETLMQQPPLNDGPRYSENLSDRAVLSSQEDHRILFLHGKAQRRFPDICNRDFYH